MHAVLACLPSAAGFREGNYVFASSLSGKISIFKYDFHVEGSWICNLDCYLFCYLVVFSWFHLNPSY